MNKEYLKAVERKLKKQGKTEAEVDLYIKNLIYPKNTMEDEVNLPSDDMSDVTGTEPIEDSSDVESSEE